MADIPIEYGNDCLLGWAAGKTPKRVYARFSEVVKCPDTEFVTYSTPPNDRAFKLTQDPGFPCEWSVRTGAWDVAFKITSLPLRTHLFLQNNVDAAGYFFSQPLGFHGEGLVFHNGYVACPPGIGAHLGIGVVTWTPQATDILESINMAKAHDLFMELFPLDDGKLVYKFCRLEDGTNVKILFEP